MWDRRSCRGIDFASPSVAMITQAVCPRERKTGSISRMEAITSLMCLHSGVAPLGEPSNMPLRTLCSKSSSWPGPFPIRIGPALFKNRISIGAPAALAKLMWKRMDSASSAQRVQLTTLSKDRKMQCERANTFWTRRNVYNLFERPFWTILFPSFILI